MTLSHITAMAKNRVIGKDSKLPWRLPEDLKFFKEKTKGKILVMGRKTFESLPGQLPERFHIVISRNSFVSDEPDVAFVKSIDEALALAKKLSPRWSDEVMIVGGGEIYKQTMALVDKIYLTVIEQDFDGDALYPAVDESEFLLIDQQNREKPFPFSFRTYVRRERAIKNV